VIVPIYKNSDQLAEISKTVNPIVEELTRLGISVKYDDSENKRPGFKFADYELKGIPVRLAIGARDIENGTIEVMRRDTLEKQVEPLQGIVPFVASLLEKIQENIFQKALKQRESMTRTVETYDEFKVEIEKGGFILAHWDGTPETEEKIKEETKATIRCIPLDGDTTPGKCMVTGRPSARRVIFARNY
ncbi:MAG: proline--tRNA ligase, partial [Muribaculaceae bacterium]|nr:proline--tRNA ligase [Muribaculaceae bacterium]